MKTKDVIIFIVLTSVLMFLLGSLVGVVGYTTVPNTNKNPNAATKTDIKEYIAYPNLRRISKWHNHAAYYYDETTKSVYIVHVAPYEYGISPVIKVNGQPFELNDMPTVRE